MARNKIDDLRNHLFAQLERLEDEEITDADLEKEVRRAKSMTSVANTIIESAKIEFDYLKLTGGEGSTFIPEQKSING